MSVLALGLVSIALLFWTRRIDERRADDAALANAVMDLRIHAATAQLWADRFMVGGSGGQRALVESALLDVAHLADVLTAGGEGKDFLVVRPPDDPDVARRSHELKRLTTEWLALNRARVLGRPSQALQGPRPLDGRAEAVFAALQQRAAELEHVIETEQVADIARSRRLFPLLLLAWSIILAASTTALLHRERARERAEGALRAGKERLGAMVAERTKALRDVNVALLTAQETERRRISTELHDQLGHSLVLMKFQIALIARELRERQAKARVACADLCGFIDRTLEDVRRLARDLRPSVLEELGLSAALHWLADNCGRDGQPIAAAIADVDALVPRDAQVVVYRIVQQAVTNAARHSEANHVCLHVSRAGDWLWFVVEDDGQGFDVDRIARAGATHEGLGLATMQERASMVGGSLEVRSEVGKGTCITLRVPVPRQEAT